MGYFGDCRDMGYFYLACADLRASSKQKSSVKFLIFWVLINSKLDLKIQKLDFRSQNSKTYILVADFGRCIAE